MTKGGVRVSEIHEVCRNRKGVARETATSFESGVWKLDEEHVRKGVVFALHQEKKQPSYLQGVITNHQADGDRFRVTVKRTPVPLPWRGGGSREGGYLWEGQDFSQLPRLSIAVTEAAVGGNAAIKWLREARDWKYPESVALRSGSSNAQRKTSSKRQAIFEHELLRIAAAGDGRRVAYAFVDAAGLACRLDDGAIRFAIQSGTILAPADRDEICRQFELTETVRSSKEFRWLRSRTKPDGARGGAPGYDRASDPFGDTDMSSLTGGAMKREVTRQVSVREGQGDFRQRLLVAYQNCCAVTGCEVPEILDAAHIVPHSLIGQIGMHVANGLLLRSDIHALLDEQLLSLVPSGDSVVVRISPRLTETEYGRLNGRALRLPNRPADMPSRRLLAVRESRLPLLY